MAKSRRIEMKTRKLGNSDLKITPIGFGAWAIGGSGWEFGWGEQDDKQSVAAIHRALELGINWIDNAAVYGMGHSEKLGVIVYSPMASGLLTGAMTRERADALSASDWRSRDIEFQEPRLSKNLALVERLREIGEGHGRPPGQMAIAWTLRNPAVTGAIVGARNAKQVEGNVGAADLSLTAEEIAEIEGKNEYAPQLVTAT